MPPDDTSAVSAQAGPAPVAIICGGGAFPGAVADAVIRRGRRPVMFGIRGWAEPAAVERHAHHWIALGQIGRFIRLAKAEQCREAVFIGTLLRPPLSQIRLDWQTLLLLPRIAGMFRGGDDRLLSGVAKLIEENGLRIIGLKDVASEIVAPEGVFGRHQPVARDRADIVRALKVIAALGPFDIGQAVVVADGNVLAVEAAEGTDNVLARLATLRETRRVTTPPGVGVLVKAPKPDQALRFDLPAIGRETVEKVARAGLAGLAVAAGNAIVTDLADVIAAADRAGIFIAGVREDAAR